MKIVFVTWHNWESKRQGGYHKFAEAAARAGHEVVFFSYPRPYYIRFKHNERLNGRVLRLLKKGTKYDLGGGASLTNCTWPTLDVPGPLRRFLPKRMVEAMLNVSLMPFGKFCDRFLKDTDCFVLESVGISLFDKLKAEFPHAKFVYRPSDPVMIATARPEAVKLEKHLLLNCDKAIIVNKQGVDLYRKNIPDFDKKVNYEILSNGVDSAAYKLEYDCPAELKRDNTALYMGALPPNMDVVFYAAERLQHVNFILVCPEPLGEDDAAKILSYKNVTYVPGVVPKEVPSWVTNANLIIVPYPENRYQLKPWGITAKCYQAMAACKPIVAYHDTEELRDFGISVTYSKQDFTTAIREHIKDGVINYDFDCNSMDWQVKTARFLAMLESICAKE